MTYTEFIRDLKFYKNITNVKYILKEDVWIVWVGKTTHIYQCE